MATQAPKVCPYCGHPVIIPAASSIQLCTNCGRDMGLQTKEEEPQIGEDRYSRGSSLMFLVMFIVYCAVTFGLIDLVNRIYAFYPNVTALMIYAVPLFAAVVVPLAYLWIWVDRWYARKHHRAPLGTR